MASVVAKLRTQENIQLEESDGVIDLLLELYSNDLGKPSLKKNKKL